MSDEYRRFDIELVNSDKPLAGYFNVTLSGNLPNHQVPLPPQTFSGRLKKCVGSEVICQLSSNDRLSMRIFTPNQIYALEVCCRFI